MVSAGRVASCANSVIVTVTGTIGDLGACIVHCDQSRADARAGFEFTYIHGGARKVDGNPHEPLGIEAAAQAQKEVDSIRTAMVSLVSSNRNVEAQAIYDTEAACFMGEDACPLLADGIGTLDDAVELAASLGGSTGLRRRPLGRKSAGERELADARRRLLMAETGQ